MTAVELLARDCARQGLPTRLTDPETIARIAAIVSQTRKAAGSTSPAGGLEARRVHHVESPTRV